MLVLGIDPGTATIGYGLVKTAKGNGSLDLCDFGLIETPKDLDHAARLNGIYKDMVAILEKYKPDVVAFERLFFFVNAKTAMQVSQAVGVMMMAVAQHNIPMEEYMPRQIKLQIAGDGRADKKQMQKTVYDTFGIKAEKNKKTHFDNTADAIAVALCHIKLAVSGT